MNPNLKVILIRGLPGSGKSTLAQDILSGYHENGNCRHEYQCGWYEADQFFENLGHFDPKLLPKAHEECLRGFTEFLSREEKENKSDNACVIVSNTFTQKWEMQPYLDVCKKYGIEPQIIVCKGNFKSIHNVPEATIEKMRQRWED